MTREPWSCGSIRGNGSAFNCPLKLLVYRDGVDYLRTQTHEAGTQITRRKRLAGAAVRPLMTPHRPMLAYCCIWRRYVVMCIGGQRITRASATPQWILAVISNWQKPAKTGWDWLMPDRPLRPVFVLETTCPDGYTFRFTDPCRVDASAPRRRQTLLTILMCFARPFIDTCLHARARARVCSV